MKSVGSRQGILGIGNGTYRPYRTYKRRLGRDLVIVGSWREKMAPSFVCMTEEGSVAMTQIGENQDGSVRSVVASGLAEGFGSFSVGTLSSRTAPAKRLSK